MTTIIRATALLLLALGLQAQTPNASIVIRVTDDAGVLYTAKITGVPASAGLDTLKQWMATQTTCDTANPPVCTPKYANAAQLVKTHVIALVEGLAPQYPSAATKAAEDDIATRKAALAAARKALFDAAKAEQ